MSIRLISIAALFLSVSTCHDHSAVQSIRLKAGALVPFDEANGEAVSSVGRSSFLDARIEKRRNKEHNRTMRGAAGLLVGGTAGAALGAPVGAVIGGAIGAGAGGAISLAGDGIASKIYNRYHIQTGRDEKKIAKMTDIADRAELLEGLIATYVRRSHNIKVNKESDRKKYQAEKKKIHIWKQYNHARGDNGDAILRKILIVLDKFNSEKISLLGLSKSLFPVLSKVVSISRTDLFDHAQLKVFLDTLSLENEKEIIKLYKRKAIHDLEYVGDIEF